VLEQQSAMTSRNATQCSSSPLLLMAGLLAAAGLALGAAGCGAGGPTIKIDGSSTVFPITEAVSEEFQNAYPGVRITVGISGTGGGFKKFSVGETDLTNASRPIRDTEAEQATANGVEFIELPVAYDALSVVVNLANTWVDYLTVDELKRIWEPAAQGKVMRWSQVRAGWPDRPMKLYAPGADSGTFDYFTEAIVGQEKASRGDFTASEDDNVLVTGVARDVQALGFFGLAYYMENQQRLRAVPIRNGDVSYEPTLENVLNGNYQPLSRPLFVYVRRQAAERPEVQRFVEFYLEHAGELATEVGYVTLQPEVYQVALGRFQKRTPGSVFAGGGSQVGINLATTFAEE
jgi:phosphate transport system substrate-binding protein